MPARVLAESGPANVNQVEHWLLRTLSEKNKKAGRDWSADCFRHALAVRVIDGANKFN